MLKPACTAYHSAYANDQQPCPSDSFVVVVPASALSAGIGSPVAPAPPPPPPPQSRRESE